MFYANIGEPIELSFFLRETFINICPNKHSYWDTQLAPTPFILPAHTAEEEVM